MRSHRGRSVAILGVAGLALATGLANSNRSGSFEWNVGLVPPAPREEFRATWVASVANIDWPSRPGLSSDQQKKELTAILDRVGKLRMNAVILQVRPACDALYASSYEPWSEYLSGQMGEPPNPAYDPLEFAVREAHRRGLELHAWFNPFRARHVKVLSSAAANHVSRVRPEWVRTYGGYQWLDPGEPAVHEYTIRVIMDVVERYDVDGVHLDDYFYPYPERNAGGGTRDFPDDSTWGRYRAQAAASGGEMMDRSHWRRANVDRFVQQLYAAIKHRKPWVKFGISPFGIWRPGHPRDIRGLDAYESLYADARLWLNRGWLDYCAPQLYWPIDRPQTSFPVLLNWWAEQNHQNRHVWPGLNTSQVGRNWDPSEITNQIQASRDHAGVSGAIHWSVRNLMRNEAGIAAKLFDEIYTEPALVPASAWSNPVPPLRPEVRLRERSEIDQVEIHWRPSDAQPVFRWIFQYRVNGRWRTYLFPDGLLARALPMRDADGSRVDAIAVRAANRYGVLSAPATFTLR